MRLLLIAMVLPLFAAVPMAADSAPRVRFTKDDLGKLPSGWKAAKTGKGEGSVWTIAADDSAPSKCGFVLAQTAESPRGLFNLCVADVGRFKDVEVQVAFKAV